MNTEDARSGLINWGLTEYTRAQIRADRLNALVQSFRDQTPEQLAAIVANADGNVTPATIRAGMAAYFAAIIASVNATATNTAAHYTALIGQNAQARKAVNKIQLSDLDPYLEPGQTSDDVKAALLAQYDQADAGLKAAKAEDAQRARTDRNYLAQLSDTIASATDDELIKLFKLG